MSGTRNGRNGREESSLELRPERLVEIDTHLRARGWIAAGARLSDARSAGEGNMNRTLRVRIEGGAPGSAASLVLKQAVPYVARFPEIPAPVERGAVEAAFHRAVSKDPALAARMPKLVGWDPAAHLLCLEDLGEKGDFSFLYALAARPPESGQADSAGREPAAEDERFVEIIDWLARLHQMSPPPDFPANAAMRALNHEHLFVIPFLREGGVELAPPLAALRTELADDAIFVESVEALGRIYLGRAPHASTPVLLHGDYYPGSWLTDPQGHARIIDPEFGFVGPAEFDVAVMRAHLAFAGWGEARWERLWQRYRPPVGFDAVLMRQFAGIEILRRLLGVAQLPLSIDLDRCLHLARASAGRVAEPLRAATATVRPDRGGASA